MFLFWFLVVLRVYFEFFCYKICLGVGKMAGKMRKIGRKKPKAQLAQKSEPTETETNRIDGFSTISVGFGWDFYKSKISISVGRIKKTDRTELITAQQLIIKYWLNYKLHPLMLSKIQFNLFTHYSPINFICVQWSPFVTIRPNCIAWCPK